MSRLESLITERKKELQELEVDKGTRFPIIEQARDIRIAYLTEELSDLEMLRDHDKYELNENQEIALDWLKGQYKHLDLLGVFSNFSNLTHLIRIFNNEEDFRIYNAFCQLTSKQQFEVLQAFAEWGLGHERD